MMKIIRNIKNSSNEILNDGHSWFQEGFNADGFVVSDLDLYNGFEVEDEVKQYGIYFDNKSFSKRHRALIYMNLDKAIIKMIELNNRNKKHIIEFNRNKAYLKGWNKYFQQKREKFFRKVQG